MKFLSFGVNFASWYYIRLNGMTKIGLSGKMTKFSMTCRTIFVEGIL